MRANVPSDERYARAFDLRDVEPLDVHSKATLQHQHFVQSIDRSSAPDWTALAVAVTHRAAERAMTHYC